MSHGNLKNLGALKPFLYSIRLKCGANVVSEEDLVWVAQKLFFNT